MAKKPKKDKSQKNPDEPDDEDIEGEDDNGTDETALPPEPPPAPAPEAEGRDKMIVIEGEGQTVIHVDGEVQYLEQGKPIKADEATLAALDAAGVEYKKKGK